MISCSDYDYIELVCLYNMTVELHYQDYSVIGVARDTKRNSNALEGIELVIANEVKWYPLDSLLAMTAITQNTFFQHLEFSH